MVLESLISSIYAEEHPKKMFFFGIVYFSVAVLLSMWIFPDQSSLLAVFLCTMATIPLLYNMIRFEEKKDLSDLPEKKILLEHEKAIMMYLWLFLGIVVSCAAWYVLLPEESTYELFRVQTRTISEINSHATGGGILGFFLNNMPIFFKILSNNIKVLIFCILFSFLYGVGAVFILTWNASVIGVAIGMFIRTEITKLATSFNFSVAAQYFGILSVGLFKYAIHGIPEILSYLVAALAGGIISVAVIRHDFGSEKYEKIVLDTSILLLISLFLVVFAAFLEVYVTPVFF